MSNWRDNPEIMAARDFCKRFNRKAAIIISFDEDGYRGISYGKDGRLCAIAGQVLDHICTELGESAMESEIEELSGG